MSIMLHEGDCLVVLKSIQDQSISSIVTDPPYGLSFMGRKWDYDVPPVAVWWEALRVLKPGGHLMAFSGTRTYHRMVVAIEDAGFEIRDQIGWLYGSGFPKSHNLAGGWDGWGTALKPAWEPIVLARKPLVGTVAGNVLAHAVGAMNVEKCRVPISGADLRATQRSGNYRGTTSGHVGFNNSAITPMRAPVLAQGRWPANVIHDGSDEVMQVFAAYGESSSRSGGNRSGTNVRNTCSGGDLQGDMPRGRHNDAGTAARFFYCAKASKSERVGSKHPTVKPVSLMRYLCRLVTPKGGTVLDPFAGSGTTGQAAVEEGFNAVLIEREAEYCADIRHRLVMHMDHAND